LGRWLIAFVAALATLSLAAAAPAQALELDPIGNFAEPVFVTSDPNDENRIFVVEKAGTITTIDGGQRRTFLDITGDVQPDGEQGLLSMAFDPGYATNRRFYVFYVAEGGGTLEIAEYTVDGTGEQAPASSRRPVISIPHPSAGNHNGGQIQIGPDGFLYISTGDGADSSNAPDLSSLLGKILRIDPDPALGGTEYSSPNGNPFLGATPGRDEIWSYGLRNPYRFSFDRLTGAFTIGDVGEGMWEEVNYRQAPPAGDGGAGVNFGWPCREGAHGTGCPASVDPVFEYDQTGPPCAITGGYVSRDPGTPSTAGRYLYADFCVGQVRSFNPGIGAPLGATGDRSEGTDLDAVSSFGEDACGRLYLATLGGSVGRIEDSTPTTAAECAAVVEPPPTEPPPVTESGPCAPSDEIGTDNADRLRGGRGDERLSGRGGADRLSGGPGDDCLDGGAGPDRLKGGGGADEIFGRGGRDDVRAGGGADVIDVRGGGKDSVHCGPGDDNVKADRRDDIAKSCRR
jgi:hypothetical protein